MTTTDPAHQLSDHQARRVEADAEAIADIVSWTVNLAAAFQHKIALAAARDDDAFDWLAARRTDHPTPEDPLGSEGKEHVMFSAGPGVVLTAYISRPLLRPRLSLARIDSTGDARDTLTLPSGDTLWCPHGLDDPEGMKPYAVEGVLRRLADTPAPEVPADTEPGEVVNAARRRELAGRYARTMGMIAALDQAAAEYADYLTPGGLESADASTVAAVEELLGQVDSLECVLYLPADAGLTASFVDMHDGAILLRPVDETIPGVRGDGMQVHVADRGFSGLRALLRYCQATDE